MDYEKIFIQADEHLKKLFIDYVWYSELLISNNHTNIGFIRPKVSRDLALFLAILNNRNLLTNVPFTKEEIDNIFACIGYDCVLPVNFIDADFKAYDFYFSVILKYVDKKDLSNLDYDALLNALMNEEIIKKVLAIAKTKNEQIDHKNNYEEYSKEMNYTNLMIINRAMSIYQALTSKNTLYSDTYNILNSLFISVISYVEKNKTYIFVTKNNELNELNIISEENVTNVFKYFKLDEIFKANEINMPTREYREKIWPKFEGFVKSLEMQGKLVNIKPIIYLYYIFNTQKYKEVLVNIYKYVFKDKWQEKYNADQILIDTSYIKLMNAVYSKIDFQEEIKKNDLNEEEEEKSVKEELKPEKIEEKTKVKTNAPASPKKSKNSKLLAYGYYLNEEEFLYNPAVGREKELKELEIDLLLPEKSILLIGNAGVGKTSIVKGFAYNLQQGKVNDYLKGIDILKVDTNNLLAGTKYRGDFEEKVKKLIDELIKNPNTIMYLEEMHTTIGLGTSSGVPLDLANILKSYLADGKIRIIGDTTIEEYNEYILQDNAFRRRFKTIMINEPDDLSLLKILDSVCLFLEEKYHISFGNEIRKKLIFQELISLTKNMLMIRKDGINDTKNNPDLVLDVLKLIFAYAKYNNHEEITKNDIYEGIMNAEGIYESRKKSTIGNLNKILQMDITSRPNKLIRIPTAFNSK